MVRSDIAPYKCAHPVVRDALTHLGFAVLPAMTCADAWSDCFAGPDVHPARVQVHARRCLDGLDNMLGWSCHMTKFRASSNSTTSTTNATDAAALHRDIMSYGPTVPPIFTLVIYLDPARLRVAPGSHTQLHIPWHRVLALGTQELDCAPGDAVLFHASLLHNGVFLAGDRDRRVVQCFDIFPDERAAAEWAPRVLHLTSPRSGESKSEGISRLVHLPGAGSLTTGLFMVHSAGGYGRGRVHLTPGADILSGEAYRSRVADDEYNRWGPANRYSPDPTCPWRRVDCPEAWNRELRAQVYGVRAVGHSLVGLLAALVAALVAGLLMALVAAMHLALKHSRRD